MSRREELEEQLSAAATEAHEWKQLLEHPSWHRFVAFMEEQKRMRAEVCMNTPITNEYTSYTQEFFKGQHHGFALALSTPQTQYELADMKRKALSQELDNVVETETRVDTEFAGRLDGDPFGGDEQ